MKSNAIRRALDKLPGVACACIALLSLAAILASPLKADANVAFFVESGWRILAGDIPYIDMFNHNLLTIQYLYVAPVAVAEALGVHPISVWLALTWAQLALSMLLCHRLSRNIGAVKYIVPLSLALASWHCLNETIFGQREHLFLIYAAPWLLLRFGRWEGAAYHGWQAAGFGFLAGIMATIKPHFLLALGLLELYWIVRQRRLRPLIAPETIGLVGACLVYGLYLLLHPAVLANMLAVIGSALEFYPQRSWVETGDVIGRPMFLLPALAGAAALIGQFAGRGRQWRLLGAFGCFTLLGGAIVLTQVGGWIYHHIVLWAGAAMCVGWGIVRLFEAAKARFIPAVFVAVAALCGVYTITTWQTLTQLRFKTPYDLQQLILDNTAPGDHVLFLTYRMGWVYPWLSVAGRHQADSRRDAWLLPQPDDEREVARETRERYARSARRDLDKSPPLIVVDDAVWHLGWRIWEFLEAYGLLDEIALRNEWIGRAERFIVFRHIGAPPAQDVTFEIGEQFTLESWTIPPSNEPLRPCDTLELRTWWRASEAADANDFSLHIDLVKAADGAVAHESYGRIGGLEDYGLLPTIIDQRELEVSCAAAAGTYNLLLSLEDMSVAGGALLPVRDTGGADYGRYIYMGTYEIGESEN